MRLEQLQPGDIVYAATALHNDGSLPEHDGEVLLVPPQARGVIINIGHLEENPDRTLYLVRFEDRDGELGPPLGCWPEELTVNVEAS